MFLGLREVETTPCLLNRKPEHDDHVCVRRQTRSFCKQTIINEFTVEVQCIGIEFLSLVLERVKVEAMTKEVS